MSIPKHRQLAMRLPLTASIRSSITRLSRGLARIRKIAQDLFESDADVLHGTFEHWDDVAGRSQVMVAQMGDKLIEIVGKNAPKLITYTGI